MATMAYEVYGMDGHRQRESFGKSVIYDFSSVDDVRKIYILREDVTHTNEYATLIIERNTIEECEEEFESQLYDGIFESSRHGKVVRLVLTV